MIRRAKRDKAQMLQVAKEKARADLEEFRKEMEASLAEKRNGYTTDSKFEDDLSRKSKELLRAVDDGFKRDAPGVVDDLITLVLKVDTSIKKARLKRTN